MLKLKSGKLHNQVVIWSPRSVLNPLQLLMLPAYWGMNHFALFFSPKKVYIIDCKTADVRVIFLFKELSHIL